MNENCECLCSGECHTCTRPDLPSRQVGTECDCGKLCRCHCTCGQAVMRIDSHDCQVWICFDDEKPARIGRKWDAWLMCGKCGEGSTFFAIPECDPYDVSTMLARKLNSEPERAEAVSMCGMFRTVRTTYPIV